jgi:hypothetical protein
MARIPCNPKTLMQSQKTALLIASLVIAGSASSFGQVLDPANGHYYEVFPARGITWNDALTAALGLHFMGLQGHLATITDSAEDTYVGAAVTAAGAGEFWLGGYQNPVTETSVSKGWTWVNSEGTFPGVNGASGFDNPYSNWNPGEPNDFYGPGSEQYLGINLGHVGGFNDEGNLNLIGGYVVEFDPNTVPGGGLVGGVPDVSTTMGLLGISLTSLAVFRRKLR